MFKYVYKRIRLVDKLNQRDYPILCCVMTGYDQNCAVI